SACFLIDSANSPPDTRLKPGQLSTSTVSVIWPLHDCHQSIGIALPTEWYFEQLVEPPRD
ncbi:hypothetical protein, partial [Acetomicrobium sp. S15 = DSM 107314]|uniref:hypothetical protein n=1 Tax=Acetomicrobium sp. S15 = DSM 107314 TaxID=2529858 RepID=UPI001E355A30